MKDITVSRRLKTIPASPIRKLIPLADAAKKRGVKVYHLNIGDPDIETPQVMLDALKKWGENPISYSQSQGHPQFLQAIKTYYHRLGYEFIDTANLQITNGGSEALLMAFLATTDIDDEIIVFEPFYTNYNSYAAVCQIKLTPVLTKPEKGFHLTKADQIEKKINKKTKAILYCSPNNPTGTVYSQKEITMLVEIAKKYRLFLISDEVYREFTYDGRSQTSLFSFFKQIPNQAIVVDSLSKRYSLCGARLGVLTSLNPEIMAGVLRIAQGRLSSATIEQVIASKLTEVSPSYFDRVRQEYQTRRDVLYEELKKIPGVFVPKPEGAFYCIVDLPIKDSEDFCRFLLSDFNLNDETIMLAPATGFYASKNMGKNQVRIAYVLNTKALKRATLILKKALEAYKKRLI